MTIIDKLKDKLGNYILPITSVRAAYTDDGTRLDDLLVDILKPQILWANPALTNEIGAQTLTAGSLILGPIGTIIEPTGDHINQNLYRSWHNSDRFFLEYASDPTLKSNRYVVELKMGDNSTPYMTKAGLSTVSSSTFAILERAFGMAKSTDVVIGAVYKLYYDDCYRATGNTTPTTTIVADNSRMIPIKIWV